MPRSNPAQRFTFTVKGRHEFPFDMLRYDCCWPKSQEDVITLAPHPRGEMYRNGREVTLMGVKEPTVGRWESFGWKVVE